MPENYYVQMQEILARLAASGTRPGLLLHACCAPCSTAVLETLMPYFSVTLYYYNPNILPKAEYEKRLDELKKLLNFPEFASVGLLVPARDEQAFRAAARGMELEPEGGARCRACYALRLAETARAADALGFAYFTTTLSVSPHKNSAWLHEIGQGLSARTAAAYLPSDFKKKIGYARSIELSRKYGLYRQRYCGCTPDNTE